MRTSFALALALLSAPTQNEQLTISNVRATYDLLGLISFFIIPAWTNGCAMKDAVGALNSGGGQAPSPVRQSADDGQARRLSSTGNANGVAH